MKYRRRVSSDEAREGYFFIEKTARKEFPKAGEKFSLTVGGKKYACKIDEEKCVCCGPESPHVHYRIVAEKGRLPLMAGKAVTLKSADGGFVLS
ncbi:Uncharacterised protein [uncultured archaeon]|nr:Uncharacterised protein [uncultured archaeon]